MHKLSLLASPVVAWLTIHSVVHNLVLALTHHAWILVTILPRWVLWSVKTTTPAIVVAATCTETTATSITLERLYLRHWLLISSIILIWGYWSNRKLVVEVCVALHLRSLAKTASSSLVALIVIESTSTTRHSTSPALKSLMMSRSTWVWLFQFSFSVCKDTLITNHAVSTILEMSAHLRLVLRIVGDGAWIEILLSGLMLCVKLVVWVRLIIAGLWHSEIHLIQILIVNTLTFLTLHLSLEVLRIRSWTMILSRTLTYFNNCFRETYDTEFAE